MPETRDPSYVAMAARIAELEAELGAAREREEAVAGVLQALGTSSESPNDVFQALLTNAQRLLGGTNATLHLIGHDGKSQLAAGAGLTPEWEAVQTEYSGWTVDAARNGPTTRVMRRNSDIGRSQAQAWASVPYDAAAAGLVPLIRDGEVIGALQVLRGDSDSAFSAEELSLLENFAAQAVIAIEQARLVRDLEASNRDVAEALEQQSAVADVLRIVASSPSDLDAILHEIARETERLCQAEHVSVAYHAPDGELRMWDSVRGTQHFQDRDSALATLVEGGHTFASAVLESGQPLRVCGPIESWEEEYPGAAVINRQDGLTELAALCVPLPGPDGPLGGLLAIRHRAVPFDDGDVETLKTFADQAVIAIENARLFSELQERNREVSEALERQAATAEVLDVVSRAPTDLQRALDAVVLKACRLLDSRGAVILRQTEAGNERVAAALHGELVAEHSRLDSPTLAPNDEAEDSASTEMRYGGPDVIGARYPRLAKLWRETGIGSSIVAPLSTTAGQFGRLVVSRESPEPYSGAQVRLLQTFADQAVIAIENARLFRELQEALERQTAIAAILGTMAGSPGDVDGTLKEISAIAARLCEADEGVIYHVFKGEQRGYGPTGVAGLPNDVTGTFVGAAMEANRPVHVVGPIDEWANAYPEAAARNRAQGRTEVAALAVPIPGPEGPVGGLLVFRTKATPFEDRHTEILETFADQAVIALENARLFSELEESNKDLNEAFDRQGATAEVMAVVGASAADSQPVFDAIVQRSLSLFAAHVAFVALKDGDNFKVAAFGGATAGPFVDAVVGESGPLFEGHYIGNPILTGKEFAFSGTIDEFRHAFSADQLTFHLWEQLSPGHMAGSVFVAPLIREGEAIGALGALRTAEHAPPTFSTEECSLVRTFADQAVIALENARLFREQQEALDRQTAMAEVLEIISRSATDAQPVLDAIVEKAARLTGAADANIFFRDGEVAREAARFDPTGIIAGAPAEVPVLETSIVGKALLESTVQHLSGDFAAWSEKFSYEAPLLQELGHEHFTGLAVPLARDGETIGCLTMDRPGVRPFSNEEIALIEAFADQAVIAIENARLFNELQERNREVSEALEREHATAEVMAVVGTSTADALPVFRSIVDRAGPLFDATWAAIYILDGDTWTLTAGQLPAGTTVRDHMTFALSPGNPGYEVVTSRRPVRFFGSLQEYESRYPADVEMIAAWRATVPEASGGILFFPLMRLGEVAGLFNLHRLDREFTDEEFATVQTFADQAVIAIENARLFNELQERNREVSEALERQTALVQVLDIISRSPTDAGDAMARVARLATYVCHAATANIQLFDGQGLRLVATSHSGTDLSAVPEDQWINPVDPDWLRTGEAIYVRDAARARGMVARAFGNPDAMQARSAFIVPLRQGKRPLGVLTAYSDELDGLSESDRAMLRAFADQAAIAVQNARLFNELQERNREVSEALAREKATAEVMAVVGASASDAQPVFKAIVERVTPLFGADYASVAVLEGEKWTIAAARYPGLAQALEGGEFVLTPGTPPYDAVTSRKPLRFQGTADEFETLYPHDEILIAVWRQVLGGSFQGVVWFPLLRAGECWGLLHIARENRSFSDDDLATVRTFADQAVIAIENARLLNELQKRNREVSEALAQQTALASVLQTISRSVFDLDAVLHRLITEAGDLVGSTSSTIWMIEGDELVARATAPATTEEARLLAGGRAPLTTSGALSTAIAERRRMETVLHPDIPGIMDAPGALGEYFRRFLRGPQSIMVVPLLRPDGAVGVFAVGRHEDQPFDERQIALIETFADQAVIAIENARLFNELQERNREVSEALERQTAMAEVLRIISSSPTDAEPVLDAIAELGGQLAGASQCWLAVEDGPRLRAVAPLFARTAGPGGLGLELAVDGTPAGEALRTNRTVHVAGSRAELRAAYRNLLPGHPGRLTILAIPLRREGKPFGVLILNRDDDYFASQQVALLETFADQAVIAIENARLFNELQESNREVSEALEVQTAMAEVLEIIGRSTQDEKPVLMEIARKAARLLGAQAANFMQVQGSAISYTATYFEPGTEWTRVPEELVAPVRYEIADPLNHFGRVVQTHQHQSYVVRPGVSYPEDWNPTARRLIEVIMQEVGVASGATVPLLKDGQAIGVIEVATTGEREYSERDIRLLQTFADQAVIAIENARLFNELQERNREVSEALTREKASAEILRQISETPDDLEATLGAIGEAIRAATDTGTISWWFPVEGGFSGHIGGVDPAWSIPTLTDATRREMNFIPADGASSLRLVVEERRVLVIPDTRDQSDDEVPSLTRNLASEMGITPAEFYVRLGLRSAIYVPVLREGRVVAVLNATSPNPNAFPPDAIAVLEAFADQASIAIANAQLLNELRERNREVTEALEREQTTGEILRQITRAPEQLRETLNAIGEAVRASLKAGATNWWFVTDDGIIATGGGYRPDVVEEIPADFTAQIMSMAEAPDQSWESSHTWVDQAMRNRRPTRIDDTLALSDEENPPVVRRMASEMGVACREWWRLVRAGTYAVVPLLLEDRVLGALDISRPEPGGFSDSEMALVASFADQAAIAIENARLLRELRERTAELEVASRHKSEFLANMSHELRTPLNAIIGYSELLQEEAADLGDEDYVPDLKKIHTAGRHLLTLISGILDLSKIEAGRMTMYLEDFDIATLVNDTRDIIEPLVERNRNRLEVDCPDGIGMMHADLVKLRQVLFNLLSNAAKFTEDGVVSLRVSRDGESVRFAISDTGIGITEEQRERLFEAFSQADASVSQKYGGTGLGLALSRSFCQMMGGDIELESEYGKGSTFTVRIPIHVRELPEAEAAGRS